MQNFTFLSQRVAERFIHHVEQRRASLDMARKNPFKDVYYELEEVIHQDFNSYVVHVYKADTFGIINDLLIDYVRLVHVDFK